MVPRQLITSGTLKLDVCVTIVKSIGVKREAGHASSYRGIDIDYCSFYFFFKNTKKTNSTARSALKELSFEQNNKQ